MGPWNNACISKCNKFLVMVIAALFSSAACADGYQTCTIAANRISRVAGVEHPVDAKYKNACLAVLPPTCRNWVVDKKPCAYRTCVVANDVSTCPNGDPAAYVAKEVLPLTKEQMEAMDGMIAMDAQKRAAGNDEGTNQAQIDAYSATRKSGWNSTGAEMVYK